MTVTKQAEKLDVSGDGAARTSRGRATRARILNCALRLMWRYGYSEIGVNRLIEEAGVLKGSFYHFFPSKLDLLLAMFDHLWSIQRRQIERIYQTKLAPAESLLAHIDWMCRAQIAAKQEEGFVPGHLHMAAGVTLIEEYPELAEKVRSMAQEHNAFIFQTLMQITPHGEAVARRQTNILFYFIAGAMMQGRLYNSLDPINEIPVFAESLIRLLQSGKALDTPGDSADRASFPASGQEKGTV
ncbi:TetR/AcrR family transcriptional repressor of nem operon [Novosphingobium hassiacum]|uniref:TetR/AcrR family transcriptional repressor of nem operon n=1 Tax=Novosphingobium hassiacum TaxID=173676 RepID=A0A7W6EW24_9SPHN|nr:TetR/AcrR family transcriptional regulator [Novosphingobium hassiacum]MBB3860942.1 TetR/AcrR family transcriptional repressor of nem operon [Novosphingobium hassiacum]